MSKYVVKYINLKKLKRLVFWNEGSIYCEKPAAWHRDLWKSDASPNHQFACLLLIDLLRASSTTTNCLAKRCSSSRQRDIPAQSHMQNTLHHGLTLRAGHVIPAVCPRRPSKHPCLVLACWPSPTLQFPHTSPECFKHVQSSVKKNRERNGIATFASVNSFKIFS